jgi:hypothetical protein
MEWTSACVMKRRVRWLFLIDVKTDLVESWQNDLPGSDKNALFDMQRL